MNQTDREYLANFVKTAGESRKLTQEQLCETTGLSQKSISDIENGRGNPTYDNLCTLLRVLDLPFSFLSTSNLSENDANLQRPISCYMSNNQKDRHILLNNIIISLQQITMPDIIDPVWFFVMLFSLTSVLVSDESAY